MFTSDRKLINQYVNTLSAKEEVLLIIKGLYEIVVYFVGDPNYAETSIPMKFVSRRERDNFIRNMKNKYDVSFEIWRLK